MSKHTLMDSRVYLNGLTNTFWILQKEKKETSNGTQVVERSNRVESTEEHA